MRPASHESNRQRSDRRGGGGGGPRPHSRGGGGAGGGGHRQEWVPRGSAPPILDHHPPPLEPRVVGDQNPSPAVQGRQRQPHLHRHHQHHHQQQHPVRPLRPPPAEAAAAPAPSSVPQLVQEIQDKLAKGSVECMICYDMVRRSAAIWSCDSCYSIFHLSCIKKWAKSPTSVDVSAASAAAGDVGPGVNWRCPGCQSVQVTLSKDLQYNCFCGRRRDPPNDLYLTPHSCGEPCGKPLDRGPSPTDQEGGDSVRCPHLCVLQCHPGPCPPCKAFAPRRQCPCGKQSIVRRCSDRKTPLSCGQKCGKTLRCGRHQCDLVCHTGPCDPCQVLITASCFCKKKTEVVLCGEMAIKGDIKEIDGVFSCNSVCGRTLACGNHLCKDECHPGPCAECEFMPSKIKTCHCGKTALRRSRASCLEPIPTCSEVCGKLLLCGNHRCKETCHEGNCPPCMAMVNQKCRCGSISRLVECYKTLDEEEVFVCEKPCGKKKNCGRHRCNERCCPLYSYNAGQFPSGWDPHLCQMPCGKRLRCGQHSCQSLCHSGHCPPCLETIFSELTCACDCRHTCTATCHPSASCPDLRCDFPVTITCSCGRITASVPCGAGGNGGGFHVDTVLETSIIQKLPVPLQAVEGNGKRVPLGQRKLTCDEECAKIERKRVLAEAFDITPPNLDALHFGENSSVSELLADLFRREPKWVVAVEERFKFLVLGRSKGSSSSSLRGHVFCPMAKDKRDAVRVMAERWKLSVHAAGWEPRRFLVVHVTPKSKPPARIIGSKAGVPIISINPPVFDSLVDMDPRLVVALLDLPRDADISALVLRFGGECELVWLNDKNALAVFADPARAATALRRLDHGSVYHGAVVLVQNAGASGPPAVTSAWGSGAKDAGAAARHVNPWKKVVASDSDSWGAADAAVPVWRANEGPIPASRNRWNVLDSDASSNLPASESPEVKSPVHQVESSSASELRAGAPPRSVASEEVDDWENLTN
ncbi:hypothetical protein Taro_003363 [Colocasia esculenta]|uniref:NF-X1-type zinc finger protein NFXL1 n=1 Tax=Colocasia esculenta TaxID=4460 RepID=A0A843TLW8_COLES|nr:hypothetical protein [Colocasia esculenta]